MNLIIQTCVPDYRVKVFNHITKKNNSVSIISGKEYYTPSIKSVHSVDKVIWIDNIFFFNRNLLFQKIPWRKVFKAKVVVIEFNLRNISLYPILIFRILLRKKIFLWGHAWSRSGKNSKSELIRLLFKKIVNGYIAYTDEQRIELERQLPNKKMFSASNAIYYKQEMRPIIKKEEEVTNFIYVGRLVKEKKPMVMVHAFLNALKKIPKESKLLIVGTGPEYDSLDNFIKKNDLKGRIILYGHVSDYNRLRELYSTSVASISPGYVGLSVTQSLGFGVPMIISKDEPHSPELEAASIGINAEYFITDNIFSLADAMCSFVLHKHKWFIKREEISKGCRGIYSVERMAEPFLTIFDKV